MQLEQAIQRYLDYVRYQQHRRLLTVEKYACHLSLFRRFMTTHYPDVDLEHITFAHLDEFVTTSGGPCRAATSRDRQYTPAIQPC